jgi:hypothetical protein
METTKYRYGSLEDFLIASELNVDFRFNDGWGAYFPVKGREIEATILFADISSFTRRTRDLTSTETLAFVNNFFAWMTAESLRVSHGIVDKYIGDEMMIVFSKDFGSEDPFQEAMQVAVNMLLHDAHDFAPSIGIASGHVTVGHVGTPLRFNTSVYGLPVTKAARCANYKVDSHKRNFSSSTIVIPEDEWLGRTLDEVLWTSNSSSERSADDREDTSGFETTDPIEADLKGLEKMMLRVILNRRIRILNYSLIERLQKGIQSKVQQGRYTPRFPETGDHNSQ